MIKTVFVSVFLAAVLVSGSGVLGADAGPAAWWKLDEGSGNKAMESISGKENEILGNVKYAEGVSGKALRFDGFTTCVVQKADEAVKPGNAMTVEAWIAPQVYPWNWTAIVNQEQEHKAGYFFGLDADGHVVFGVSFGGVWHSAESKGQVELLKWNHVAATVDRQVGIRIYINGDEAGSGAVGTENGEGKMEINRADGIDTLIGKSRMKMSPKYCERKWSEVVMSDMLFDGLIDELKIYTRSLSAEEIKGHYVSLRPREMQPLKWQAMPSGPPGPGRFGAYYTRLMFTEEWENLWRVGDYPDIVVRFDEIPVKAVFWRGTSYGLSWVTENGLWMGDQSVEANYRRKGCNEHMSDKQCRYSHVRVIEENDARVIVHWRYAACGIDYTIVNTDETGWGDWVDEYYVIYPDGAATRHWVYRTSAFGKPGSSLQLQETIFFNQPGMKPEDTVELEALTLANMDGESHSYSWANGLPPDFTEPKEALIQITNMKSQYRPFIIFEPGSKIIRFGGHNPRSHFRWWNHWPVAQLANEGRMATEPGRPSHSSITSGDAVIHKGKGLSYEAVILCGMTTKAAGKLAALARSWNYPAEANTSGAGFRSEGYDKYERAYVMSRSDKGESQSLQLTLAASEKSPVVNPAFVVKDWGEADVRLKINGKDVVRGKDFRFGHRYRLEGTDLVVWMKAEKTEPVRISMFSAERR